jgi:hypothetical protein
MNKNSISVGDVLVLTSSIWWRVTRKYSPFAQRVITVVDISNSSKPALASTSADDEQTLLNAHGDLMIKIVVLGLETQPVELLCFLNQLKTLEEHVRISSFLNFVKSVTDV